jgi:hypothetical protein
MALAALSARDEKDSYLSLALLRLFARLALSLLGRGLC